MVEIGEEGKREILNIFSGETETVEEDASCRKKRKELLMEKEELLLLPNNQLP